MELTMTLTEALKKNGVAYCDSMYRAEFGTVSIDFYVKMDGKYVMTWDLVENMRQGGILFSDRWQSNEY